MMKLRRRAKLFCQVAFPFVLHATILLQEVHGLNFNQSYLFQM